MEFVYECDLHGHTNRSDGNDTPKEFVDHAASRGVKVAAITDHDIVPPDFVLVEDEHVDIHEYAKSKNVRLIKGIEISTETYIDDVHLVCLGCDWTSDYFNELDLFTRRSKINSYKKLILALKEMGMDLTWDEVMDNNGHPVSEDRVQKKMIFELMARKGYVKSWSDAKILVNNSDKLNIKREKPDAAKTIKRIHEVGGIVILAHPYLIKEKIVYDNHLISRDEWIEILIENGLDGIEACYTYNKTSYDGNLSPEEIERIVRKKYESRGLIISGGSDYHGDGKKGVKKPREIGERGISFDELCKYEKLRRLIGIDS